MARPRKTSENVERPGAVAVSPAVRREMAVRRNLDKYGNPLEMLARLAQDGDKDAAKAILPYYFPTLKSVELTGDAANPVSVEITKIAPG